jgi:HAD superfamily hydrolase (TIGR01549 family)
MSDVHDRLESRSQGLPSRSDRATRARRIAVKAVLLDVDGTLVDSNDAHARAWVDVFAEAGHDVSFGRIRRLIGVGGDKVIADVTGLSEDAPEAQRLSQRRQAIFTERYLPHLRAFEGAGKLLESMRRHGLRLVVASSARQDELRPLLRLTGAADAIEAAASSDDVERSKPDPDIVSAALGTSGEPAQSVVMIGDTPYDLAAAAAAGVRFIAFRCGGWPDAVFEDALAVFDGPADLLARYNHSPLALGLPAPPTAQTAQNRTPRRPRRR